MCLLFAWGKFPRLGKMKTAYEQAEQGIQFGAADAGEEDDAAMVKEMVANDPRKQNVSVWNLMIPMVLLIYAMFAFDFNGFLCFMLPILACGILYICQGIFNLAEYIDCYIQGCRDMMDMTLILFPTLLVVLPEVGANVPMCLAAIISAGLFGANTCVISDLGIIAAKSCRVNIYDQFVACQPYYWICFVITAVGYLALGFLF